MKAAAPQTLPLSAEQSSSSKGNEHARTGWVWAVCGLLLLAVGLVFGQTVRHDFINLDDPGYVFENPRITAGLTPAGIWWALTDGPYGEWQPLTALSHMLDCQLYGVEHPGGHHLTSVVLHAVSAVLLFLVLLRMTNQRAVPEAAQASGVRVAPADPIATTTPSAKTTPSATTLWPCAWVAAVFAIHPLHVSTVAWVAERREVLAGLFFMLTLGAYALYVERPSLARYLAVAGFLAMGLMSKAILVTVPFVLLLLDYWPLRRFEIKPALGLARLPIAWRLVLEKIPLLGLSVANCAIVLSTHASLGLADRVEPLSFSTRLGNALVAYGAYLGQSFYPVNFSIYYPHRGTHLPTTSIVASAAGLATISLLAGLAWRRMPYFAVGWFWFVGMLVPVLGLVGQFLQARADNYTYLSQIGLSIAVAWTVSTAAGSWQPLATRHWTGPLLGAVSAASVLLLAAIAARETTWWHHSETIWAHAAGSTSDNLMAHHFLACLYARDGKIDEAIAEEEQALACDSIDRYWISEAHLVLADCLTAEEKPGEALPHFEEAVRISPGYALCHSQLAVALASAGQLDRAILEFRQTVRLAPDSLDAQINLANVLLAKGETGEAAELCREVLKKDANAEQARTILNRALAAEGKFLGPSPARGGPPAGGQR